MKKNMGSADRVIRFLIAALLVTLYFTNVLTGALAVVLLIVAGVFALTSLTGNCPLYALFGIRTCKTKEPGNKHSV